MTGRLGGGIDVYATENIVVSLDASYVIPAGDLAINLPTVSGEATGHFPYASFSWGFLYRF